MAAPRSWAVRPFLTGPPEDGVHSGVQAQFALPPPTETSGRRLVSHEMVLGGKLATKTSFSLSRPSSPRVEDLKGEPSPTRGPTRPSRALSRGHGARQARPCSPAWPSPALLWADHRSRPSPGAALYGRLKEYLLTEDQLKENGYPFPHPERPGGAVLFTAEEKKPKDCEWLQAVVPGLDGGGGRSGLWAEGQSGA